MKKYIMLIAMILFANNLQGKEYSIFPGIGYLNEVRGGSTVDTIDGKVFYNPKVEYLNKVLKNNRLLLQKNTDLSMLHNQLTQVELLEIDSEFKDISALIDQLDLSKKLATYMMGWVTVDAKAAFDFTWDIVSAEIKEHYKGYSNDHMVLSTVLDITEQVVRAGIDVSIELYSKALIDSGKKGFESALFGKYISSAVKDFIGKATAWYDGVVNTTKLINTLNALFSVNAIQKQQAHDTLISSFIYAYILEYKSNINKMHDAVIPENSSKDTNNFWSVWSNYHLKNNEGLRKFYTTKELYDIAIETQELIQTYGKDFFINIGLREFIFDDGKELVPFADPRSINKKYFIPKNIEDYNIHYSFLSGPYADMNRVTFVIYFSAESARYNEYTKKVDGTEEKINVRLVENAKITIKTYLDYAGDFEEIENYKIYLKSFFVPSFFGDVPNDYWALPSIAKLFNKGVIQGYEDRTFRPKPVIKDGIEVGYTSIGEFLAMSSRAIYGDEFIVNYHGYKDVNGIVFSKYVEFLKNELKLDIGIGSYTQNTLDQRATRGYVAKVLTSMIRQINGMVKLDYGQLDGDWDTYSDFLSQKCIVHGREDLSNPGYKKFVPNDNIPRDEIVVMIAKSIPVGQGEKLQCLPRKKYSH